MLCYQFFFLLRYDGILILMPENHTPVMAKEAIASLNIKPDGFYLDATFGRGGHSRKILSQLGSQGRLQAIDRDLQAVERAVSEFGNDSRFTIYHANFAEIDELSTAQAYYDSFDGVLLDLGVSSPQLDDSSRGFSFRKDGPLDMRMNKTSGITAAEWINSVELDEMVSVFKTYGEERYSLRIARAIVKFRLEHSINTTMQLAEIVKLAHPNWERGKHPATRVFQAIRIEVNGELDSIKKFLLQSHKFLRVGGRLVIISFHSLEDRIVKRFIRNGLREPEPLRNLPILDQNKHHFRSIGKPVNPAYEEFLANKRARSSVLRVAERFC